MIIVTGTKRSGTSMWMQILVAAGFPHVGDAFPGVWGESIAEANRRGFFESPFRHGIFYRTNPNPDTGQFIHPKAVRGHVVKVFVPGLVRSDYAFIGPVVASMRHWREYSASLQRLHRMEDDWREAAIADGREAPRGPFSVEATMARVRAGQTPPALEWFFDNYDLIRDAITRKYPFHMTTYDRLLADPEAEIHKVLTWLGRGDLAPAVAAVEPELRTQTGTVEGDDELADVAEVFDELYHAVNVHQTLSKTFVQKLNETNQLLTERWDDVVKARLKALRQGMIEG